MTIRELRQQTGLSQSKFATQYGLNLRTLQAWERGARNAPESVLLELNRKINRNNTPLRILRCIEDDIPFDTFRSEICHEYKYVGDDYRFCEIMIESDMINNLWNKNWRAKALYMMAIMDFIADKYDVDPPKDYDEIRNQKLKDPLIPQSIRILDRIGEKDYFDKAIKECSEHPVGKFFYKYNIIEKELTDVV